MYSGGSNNLVDFDLFLISNLNYELKKETIRLKVVDMDKIGTVYSFIRFSPPPQSIQNDITVSLVQKQKRLNQITLKWVKEYKILEREYVEREKKKMIMMMMMRKWRK